MDSKALRNYWHWKQETPYEQLIAITSSIEGNTSLLKDLKDGWVDVRGRIDCIIRNAAELNDLSQYLIKGSW